MENKKLGWLFIGFSIVFFIFLIYFNFNMNQQSINLGCNPSEECHKISGLINMVNVGFGFFGFMLALGSYLLFFNKNEQSHEKIMKRLEQEKDEKLKEDKFDIILKALDSYEKKVLELIKEQNGVTQNTLRLRADMSKAKLSYVLQDLEKKNLIKRKKKGKTLEIWLRI